MADEAALRIDGLRYAPRPGARLLDGLTLEVAAGEWVSLLAASGAGATSLLRLATGELRPEAGRITAPGAWLAAPPRGGLPWESLAQRLAQPLRRRGVPVAERDALVTAMLDALQLRQAAEQPPSTLSETEAQRAAIGAALLAEAPLLLLDDPFSAHDVPRRAALLDLLRERQRRQGFAVLHVARDAAEAMAVADRLAILDRGRILQTGAPEAVFDMPASATAARLTGAANLLAGQVEEAEDEDGLTVVRLDAGPLLPGRAVRPLRRGARVWLLVRPEHVAVAAMAAEALGEGAIGAKVLAVRPQGARMGLRLALADGTVMEALRPRGFGAAPKPGSPCALAWPPQAARVLLQDLGS
ncbi:MAG TPA: ATP-binding cassette domain-containing protein [Roseomonas sp.]|jgi:ABC-type Fe3+/spermidine/putrescine transport system ATPase subunit